jgi:hypothetical protein
MDVNTSSALSNTSDVLEGSSRPEKSTKKFIFDRQFKKLSTSGGLFFRRKIGIQPVPKAYQN